MVANKALNPTIARMRVAAVLFALKIPIISFRTGSSLMAPFRSVGLSFGPSSIAFFREVIFWSSSAEVTAFEPPPLVRVSIDFSNDVNFS
ncbi:hypothetical protein OOK36_23305 [Streptomyces sp. NBC_00365]|uniref:hypothetical protein n=1 Tax=Streptomyces sp. NBC_00365 TaxID=2975726 RepID=UPI00225807DB|nr:hypothetical protein [Streptomyces sp. NBC_00365]MCX5091754.1 hypothetical protein [Streptomyces sp. NBC_00365]